MSKHTAHLKHDEVPQFRSTNVTPTTQHTPSVSPVEAARLLKTGQAPHHLNKGKNGTYGVTSGATQSHKVHTHHFPLYSHPMFRAAIHDSDAVRTALDAQAGQVDHDALDLAVESMVEALLQQQQQQQQQFSTGGLGSGEGGENIAVSEAQLLALLASVSRTPAPSVGQPQQVKPAPVSSPVQKEEGEVRRETASALQDATFASTAGLHTRPLPHSTRHLNTMPSSSAERNTPLVHSDVQVVSVNALQTAAMAYTRRTSQIDLSPDTFTLPESRSVSPYVSPITQARGNAEETSTVVAPSSLAASAAPSAARGAGARATTLDSRTEPRHVSFAASHPPPTLTKSGLYSLLPMSSAMRDGCPERSSGIPFAEMDRRPGVGTGPVAQQSVDAHRLHHVSDSVFAAMDVLMDGNSSCMRRRRRGQGQGSVRGTPQGTSFGDPRSSSGSVHSFASTAPVGGLALPPPPRTAAEAKARRILESQRRRQRQTNASLSSADGHATAPRADEDVKRPPVGGSASPVSLPPIVTMRGMASHSLLAKAVNSAHQFNAPYK